ncbi:L-lactate permease [Helicobacter sp. 13S00401-1]|uniref:lactate permease LctP family transporter n=1 Tax=Helicobacter sp. 13S00401-1 TaxID=1905758 RepID=UPI000BA6536D|nr:lactate permease LctP family transporter [Helicobacter sp. 13S00401-1]PAF50247.1 L-lactate permease [Helicobacter sp. 13S00401-1]
MGIAETSAHWLQNYNPLGNLWLSGFVALLPIILFFLCLIAFKMKGWLAALLTVILSIIIALVMYKMPFGMVIMSFIKGFLYGIWPIAWIIIAAIFLFKLSDKTGYFKILQDSVMTITPDHRIQVILVAFCLGAFLEGAIGFGAPVAIAAALLVGLGLRPLYAASLCLVGNTIPVAFGAVGIPIVAMAGLVDMPASGISAMVGRMLPPFIILLPFVMIFLMDRWKGIKETWPALLVAGISFAILQYLTTNYIGPELGDIIPSVISLVLTAVFMRFWKPKRIFRTDGKELDPNFKPERHPAGKVVLAWIPFVLLIIAVVIWSTPWFKDLFKAGGALALTNISWHMPFITGTIFSAAPITATPKVIATTYTWDIIHATGTALLIAGIISIFVLRAKPAVVGAAIADTFKEMWIPIITIGLVVSFAFITQYSGAGDTMGLALAQTGHVYTFFAPIVGWIGVFLTGSDTSSNLLFGTLQQATAIGLHVPEVFYLALNSFGGIVGKMISPQSIAVACAAVGIVGQESALFRKVVIHSVWLVVLMSIWAVVVYYVFPSMIVNIAHYVS